MNVQAIIPQFNSRNSHPRTQMKTSTIFISPTSIPLSRAFDVFNYKSEQLTNCSELRKQKTHVKSEGSNVKSRANRIENDFDATAH